MKNWRRYHFVSYQLILKVDHRDMGLIAWVNLELLESVMKDPTMGWP